jgi:tRNA(Ile2) C34 agmatinyltransferase TiaS
MDDEIETIRAAMRLLAKRARQPRLRVCAVCGKEYEGIGRSMYCGRTCRTRAYRARKAPEGASDAAAN